MDRAQQDVDVALIAHATDDASRTEMIQAGLPSAIGRGESQVRGTCQALGRDRAQNPHYAEHLTGEASRRSRRAGVSAYALVNSERYGGQPPREVRAEAGDPKFRQLEPDSRMAQAP